MPASYAIPPARTMASFAVDARCHERIGLRFIDAAMRAHTIAFFSAIPQLASGGYLFVAAFPVLTHMQSGECWSVASSWIDGCVINMQGSFQ